MHAYDPTDRNSIYNYAKKLEGKTFNDVCDEDETFIKVENNFTAREQYKEGYGNRSRKGGLGEIIEERYFHYPADNIAQPDFNEANIELKVTPFKINKNKTISAKERLIISMINYMEIVHMDFYNSNAWEKIENILLVYYLWEEDIEDRLDYIIEFVHLFSPNKNDLRIIENDFYKIKQKVIDGNAHNLSEGDTLYLGAATKSSNSHQRTPQPFSEIPAKPRAFSLKSSYMTYVLRNYITNNYEVSERIVSETEESKLIIEKNLLKHIDFENIVLKKINKFKGYSDHQLFSKFFANSNLRSKDKYSRIVYEILKIRTKNAEEFEKARIEVKTIRINVNNKIKESMSFPTFEILDLINQEWEESDIYNFFSETKFLFVVFQEQQSGGYKLEGAFFWNMPSSDIYGKLEIEWKRAKYTFKNGVEFSISKDGKRVSNNLPKKSNTDILHVRPHASRSAYLIDGVKYGNGVIGRDTDVLPNGDKMTKQCFWLNNDYILKQIRIIK